MILLSCEDDSSRESFKSRNSENFSQYDIEPKQKILNENTSFGRSNEENKANSFAKN